MIIATRPSLRSASLLTLWTRRADTLATLASTYALVSTTPTFRLCNWCSRWLFALRTRWADTLPAFTRTSALVTCTSALCLRDLRCGWLCRWSFWTWRADALAWFTSANWFVSFAAYRCMSERMCLEEKGKVYRKWLFRLMPIESWFEIICDLKKS